MVKIAGVKTWNEIEKGMKNPFSTPNKTTTFSHEDKAGLPGMRWNDIKFCQIDLGS